MHIVGTYKYNLRNSFRQRLQETITWLFNTTSLVYIVQINCKQLHMQEVNAPTMDISNVYVYDVYTVQTQGLPYCGDPTLGSFY